MTNETFFLLSEEDRNTKLRAVLKSKSAGHLTEDEIQGILRCISLNRQYRVSVSYGRAEYARIMEEVNSLPCQIVFPLAAMKKSLTFS